MNTPTVSSFDAGLKASRESAKLFDIVTTTFARSVCCKAPLSLKRFQLSGRYFQNPLRRIGSAISGLCPDSDNPDKPLFFDCGDVARIANRSLEGRRSEFHS